MSNNPLIPAKDTSQDGKLEDPAVRLIRDKVARAYSGEPDAVQELAEAEAERAPSKHQLYMRELSASGKSLAEIQTEWHHYYTMLPDAEKHEVWQEFYAANQHTPYQKLFQKQQPVVSRKAASTPETPTPTQSKPTANGVYVGNHEPSKPTTQKHPTADTAATKQLKSKIVSTVTADGKLKIKHHLQSLAFGLGSGAVVLFILLFGFFNEFIIAPLIQPSRTVNDTPIILSDNTTTQNVPPSVTVPKINVQIPLNFNVPTTDEAAVEEGLKTGVVHYPNTVMPGQNGNAAYFGHSAVNIFNNGVKYKFAFSLLHEVTTGDLFYITYGGKTFAYRVFEKQVVPPTQVSVISDTRGKTATAVLITCDPPGVSTNRLVVWGEQISPNPSGNTNADPAVTAAAPAQLASNGLNMWSKFVHALEFWK